MTGQRALPGAQGQPPPHALLLVLSPGLGGPPPSRPSPAPRTLPARGNPLNTGASPPAPGEEPPRLPVAPGWSLTHSQAPPPNPPRASFPFPTQLTPPPPGPWDVWLLPTRGTSQSAHSPQSGWPVPRPRPSPLCVQSCRADSYESGNRWKVGCWVGELFLETRCCLRGAPPGRLRHLCGRGRSSRTGKEVPPASPCDLEAPVPSLSGPQWDTT